MNPGKKVGPYEILSPLGAGGMGEVWRARDTQLNRDVALKVLPEVLSRDPERMARFKREAQVLASLNHPNIAAIYGFEESDGVRALVMELVEGPTLAEKILVAQGPLSDPAVLQPSKETEKPQRRRAGAALQVDDALPIARQIAEGLEYAHERGIIHRDLKPANIKVTPEGTVKILDFGLAKALETPLTPGPSPQGRGEKASGGVPPSPEGRGWPAGPGEGSVGLDNSPTLTAAATQAGIILGTAAYMSPEQARGKPVDRRADIWAFGCVLFEMFTGKRPFEGETVTDVLASVVVKEPAWEALPSGTPPRIREVIRRSLIKDPKQRLQAIGEARIAIEETIAGVGAIHESPLQVGGETPPLQPAWRRALPWAVGIALGAILATIVFTAGLFRKSSAKPSPIHFTIPVPEGTYPGTIAVSPDGKSIAYLASSRLVSNAALQPSLWVRELGADAPRRLAEVADDFAMPFWSPDSRNIGFFSDGKLKTVPADGGPVQTICDAKDARGGAWSPKGVILFGELTGPVMRVQATGGTPVSATTAEASYRHVGPEFLPDGNHFIYTRANDAGFLTIQVGSLDSKELRTLPVNSQTWGLFAPPDHLLFIRNGALTAQKFDTERIELMGEPLPVSGAGAGGGFGAFTASDAVLAYHAPLNGGIQWFPTAQLTWYDRAGKELGTVGPVGNYLEAKLSPDGKLVVADAGLDLKDPWGSANLFLLDLSNGVYSRMTLGEGRKEDPVWSPDSRSVVYSLYGKGFMELGVGQSQPSEVISNGVLRFTDDWSKDGNYIISRSIDQRSAYALPMTGERKPILMVKDAFVRDQFHFSPDSRWVAYNSNESGRMEVYIASFPKMDHKHQVSTGGGGEPLWRGDGKELYFLNPDGKLMSVNVTEREDVETSTPKMLFQTGLKVNNGADQYTVTADGKKFLLVDPVKIQAANSQAAEPIHVIVNWESALGKP